MLEYFTYKKVKKHKAEKEAQKAASASASKDEATVANTTATDLKHDASDISRASSMRTKPILKHEDERFIENLLSTTDDEPAPPLPSRDHLSVPEWHADWSSSDEETSKTDKGKGKGKAKDVAPAKEEKKTNRLSLLFSRNKKPAEELKPDEEVVTPKEAEREKNDLGRVLDRLNLSAKNNKVVSLGSDSGELLGKFTQVFKDLANGVPTAYDDLTKLIEDRDGTIAKGFDKLPSSLQKLVTQLPDKITGSLGPEILATAAKSQGLKAAGGEGFKDTAKNILMPHNLAELVTKPGAIAGMLRAIVEALKARWPAFLGMNVIWSVALTRKFFKHCL